MYDLISRAEAIKAIENLPGAYNGWSDAYDKAYIIGTLEEIPSAQRKHGEWIVKENHGTGWYRITCSECGEDVTSTAPCIGFMPIVEVLWDYCPYCGAKMGTACTHVEEGE